MKFATALVATYVATASAFAPAQQTLSSTALNMADKGYSNFKDNSARNTKEMSEAVPFLEKPAMLDGEFAGDVGFDPFGFASSKELLYQYREAEIKHGRLAMLAAAGWPLAELFDRKIANIFNAEPMVDASERNPSLLNGGLGKISPLYWVACLVAAAAIDIYGIRKTSQPGYEPGNLGWDPLGLYPNTKGGQRRMELAEIKHGRLGMIAITAFAFQEYAAKYAVVAQTPSFFKPAPDVVSQYGSSGDLTPNL